MNLIHFLGSTVGTKLLLHFLYPLSGSMKRKTEAQREMREHLDNIKALEDENGNTLNSLFMTQNDQRQYPELMKAMKKPISIQNIEQKLMDGRYKTLKKFMKDLNSLINAVKLSFQEDDAIHKEALILEVKYCFLLLGLCVFNSAGK